VEREMGRKFETMLVLPLMDEFMLNSLGIDVTTKLDSWIGNSFLDAGSQLRVHTDGDKEADLL
jgi:hypothetical protein